MLHKGCYFSDKHQPRVIILTIEHNKVCNNRLDASLFCNSKENPQCCSFVQANELCRGASWVVEPYHPALYLYFGEEMLSSKPNVIGAMGPVFSFYVDVARQLGLLHLEKLTLVI